MFSNHPYAPPPTTADQPTRVARKVQNDIREMEKECRNLKSAIRASRLDKRTPISAITPDLPTQKQQLVASATALTTELDTLRREVDERKRALASCSQTPEIVELRKAAADLLAKVAKMVDNDTKMLSVRLALHTLEDSDFLMTINDEQKQLLLSDAEYIRQERENSDKDELAKELQRQVVELNNNLTSATEELERERSQGEAQMHEKEELVKERNALLEDQVQSSNREASLTADLVKERQKTIDLTKEVTVLSVRLQEGQEKNEELQNKYDESLRSLGRLQKRMEEVNSELGEGNARLEGYDNREATKLTELLEKAKATITAAETRAQDAENRLQDAESQLEDLNKTVAGYTAALHNIPELEKQLDSANYLVSKLRGEVESRDSALRELEENRKKLFGEIERSKERAKKFSERATAAQNSLGEANKKLLHAQQEAESRMHSIKKLQLEVQGLKVYREAAVSRAVEKAKQEAEARQPAVDPLECVLKVTSALSGVVVTQDDFGDALALLLHPGRNTARVLEQGGRHWQLCPSAPANEVSCPTHEVACLNILDELSMAKRITALTEYITTMAGLIKASDKINFELVKMALQPIFDQWGDIQELHGARDKVLLSLALSQAVEAVRHFKDVEEWQTKVQEFLAEATVLPALAMAMNNQTVREFCQHNGKIWETKDVAVCHILGTCVLITFKDHHVFQVMQGYVDISKTPKGKIYIHPLYRIGMEVELSVSFEDGIWWMESQSRSCEKPK
ncbi:hypothetical protein V8F20_009734 [Naviculisporaceae sp. PSN 640]